MKEMNYSDRCKIYDAAIGTYGKNRQVKKLLEEMAELQDAIIKYDDERDTLEHVAEELADVTIMLEQARLMFNVNELVSARMTDKCVRLACRVSPAAAALLSSTKK